MRCKILLTMKLESLKILEEIILVISMQDKWQLRIS